MNFFNKNIIKKNFNKHFFSLFIKNVIHVIQIMKIDAVQHILYSESPELFMKDKWLTFDAFESKTIKNIKPFDYQLDFIKNIHSKNNHIIAKGRQMHVSSMMALYISWYVIFNNDKNVFILSDSAEGSRNILDKVKVILQNYFVSDIFHWQDDFIKNSKSELLLKNGCRIIAAAPSITAMRGWAIDFMYIDEAAFIKHFEEIYAASGMYMQCKKDSRFIIASTPKDNSTFNKLFLSAGYESYFNPIKLHWSIHPVYSKDIIEEIKESPFRYSSPWFYQMFRMLGEDINATERLINCVVIYKDETSKIKTISLRIDSDLHEKLQAKLKPGVSLSDYIRRLIEKDIS